MDDHSFLTPESIKFRLLEKLRKRGGDTVITYPKDEGKRYIGYFSIFPKQNQMQYVSITLLVITTPSVPLYLLFMFVWNAGSAKSILF